MAYVSVLVRSADLDAVLFDLLSGFHGWGRADFEVYNAWSLSSDLNELFLSPIAYACLASAKLKRYEVLGEVEAPPPGCDLLMGDQQRRPPSAVELPTYFATMSFEDLDVADAQHGDRT